MRFKPRILDLIYFSLQIFVPPAAINGAERRTHHQHQAAATYVLVDGARKTSVCGSRGLQQLAVTYIPDSCPSGKERY